MNFQKTTQLVLTSLLGLFCLLYLLSSIIALQIARQRRHSQRTRIAIWCLALANAVALMVNTVKWSKAGQFDFPGAFGTINVDRCASDSFFLIFTICLSAVFPNIHEVRPAYFANYVRLILVW
jgi:hypothetical protein